MRFDDYCAYAELPKHMRAKLDKLQALEEHGVDNWEGYGEAMRSLNSEEDED